MLNLVPVKGKSGSAGPECTPARPAEQDRPVGAAGGPRSAGEPLATRVTGTIVAVLLVVYWAAQLTGGGLTFPRSALDAGRPAERREVAAHSPAVAAAVSATDAARAARDEAAARLVDFELSSYRHGARSDLLLPADTASALDAQRNVTLSASVRDSLRQSLQDKEQALTQAEEEERQAIAAYLEAEHQRQLAEQRQRIAAAVRAGGSGSTPRCGSDFDCFRACTIQIESHGNYETDTGNSYFGAWQFNQGTWNSNAAAIGRDDLVGINPATASPADQDLVAYHLWQARGNQPWGGRC